VAQQGEHAVTDHVGGRLVTGDEQQEDHREQLVFIEGVALLLGNDQRADQIVLGIGAFVLKQCPQVRGEVRQGGPPRRGELLAFAEELVSDYGLGPIAEPAAVPRGHPE
jgi:hypothetical protein